MTLDRVIASSFTVWQQGGLTAQRRIQSKPRTNLCDGGAPQRNGSLLASLALQMHTSATVENDVGNTYADDLRDPRTGVVEHGQEQMVALRCPTSPRVGRGPQASPHA